MMSQFKLSLIFDLTTDEEKRHDLLAVVQTCRDGRRVVGVRNTIRHQHLQQVELDIAILPAFPLWFNTNDVL